MHTSKKERYNDKQVTVPEIWPGQKWRKKKKKKKMNVDDSIKHPLRGSLITILTLPSPSECTGSPLSNRWYQQRRSILKHLTKSITNQDIVLYSYLEKKIIIYIKHPFTFTQIVLLCPPFFYKNKTLFPKYM